MLKSTSVIGEREAAKKTHLKKREEAKAEDGVKKEAKPDDREKKPTVTPEKVCFEALLRRAEERNIDMERFVSITPRWERSPLTGAFSHCGGGSYRTVTWLLGKTLVTADFAPPAFTPLFEYGFLV